MFSVPGYSPAAVLPFQAFPEIHRSVFGPFVSLAYGDIVAQGFTHCIPDFSRFWAILPDFPGDISVYLAQSHAFAFFQGFSDFLKIKSFPAVKSAVIYSRFQQICRFRLLRFALRAFFASLVLVYSRRNFRLQAILAACVGLSLFLAWYYRLIAASRLRRFGRFAADHQSKALSRLSRFLLVSANFGTVVFNGIYIIIPYIYNNTLVLYLLLPGVKRLNAKVCDKSAGSLKLIRDCYG